MNGEDLKREINQGVRNKYRVFVDTVDGSQHRVYNALNASTEQVTVKLKNGLAIINADKVTALRKLELNSNKPEDEQ
ncbi:hypothetical protein AB6F27_05615 [Staphylococcus saprophyticus]|uniref:hypothetical protein n=1 Tax=Staphylococcus saprophyticus TaxID=29385 RepID=UPI0034DD46FD